MHRMVDSHYYSGKREPAGASFTTPPRLQCRNSLAHPCAQSGIVFGLPDNFRPADVVEIGMQAGVSNHEGSKHPIGSESLPSRSHHPLAIGQSPNVRDESLRPTTDVSLTFRHWMGQG